MGHSANSARGDGLFQFKQEDRPAGIRQEDGPLVAVGTGHAHYAAGAHVDAAATALEAQGARAQPSCSHPEHRRDCYAIHGPGAPTLVLPPGGRLWPQIPWCAAVLLCGLL